MQAAPIIPINQTSNISLSSAFKINPEILINYYNSSAFILLISRMYCLPSPINLLSYFHPYAPTA